MKKPVRPGKKLITAALAMACAMILFFAPGCGEKKPPLPPLNPKAVLISPADLKLVQEEDVVHLVWSYNPEKAGGVQKPDLFEVYAATKTFEDCEGCPFKFELTGIVEMPEKQFYYKLKKGLRYYFRVRALDGGATPGPYSRTVSLEYP